MEKNNPNVTDKLLKNDNLNMSSTPKNGLKNIFHIIDFLGHLSHSGDLLLWVGVRRRSSCVVRRALTSSSQELLGQS